MTPAETGTPLTDKFAASCMTNQVLVNKKLENPSYKANLMEIEFVLSLEHARSLEHALSASRAECERVKRALCSLTPGGSEYVGDPDACVAYVRRTRLMQHETILKFAKEKKQAEQSAAQLRAELEAARAALREAPTLEGLPVTAFGHEVKDWQEKHAATIESAQKEPK